MWGRDPRTMLGIRKVIKQYVIHPLLGSYPPSPEVFIMCCNIYPSPLGELWRVFPGDDGITTARRQVLKSRIINNYIKYYGYVKMLLQERNRTITMVVCDGRTRKWITGVKCRAYYLHHTLKIKEHVCNHAPLTTIFRKKAEKNIKIKYSVLWTHLTIRRSRWV